MKRMLINATQPEEVRVAIVDENRLEDLDIETPHREQKKSNIYKGLVTRIEPSLEAVFVDYGADRHGFLPFKEISPAYIAAPEGDHHSLKDRIHVGQELIVQIEREERGQKGAALTTYVSLAGRYVVLAPNNPQSTGISRRVEGDDRDEMRGVIHALTIPEGMGVIGRTASVGKNPDELQWDLDYLLQLWKAITQATEDKKAPFLIYQESNLIIRTFRDYLRKDITEVLIDDLEFYENARDFVQLVIPQHVNIIQHYTSEVPLFTQYKIEQEVERIFQPEIRLHSGGAIIINHTEALVAIDVNSSKATQGSDIEETALNTNLEAANEIARQLRIRDTGGLIVIDFIDMMNNDHQRKVENALRDAFRADRARVQTGRISRFGLMEMSRQRLRSSLGEAFLTTCPRCTGKGKIRETQSLAHSILRLAEEKAITERATRVQLNVPVDIGIYLLNEQRNRLQALEQKRKISIVVLPLTHLHTPHFEIKCNGKVGQDTHSEPSSFQQVRELSHSSSAELAMTKPTKAREVAAIGILKPEAAQPQERQGLLKRLYTTLFGEASPQPEKPIETSSRSPSSEQQNRNHPRRRHPDRGRGGPRNNRHRDFNRRRRRPGNDSQSYQGNRPNQNPHHDQSQQAPRPAQDAAPAPQLPVATESTGNFEKKGE